MKREKSLFNKTMFGYRRDEVDAYVTETDRTTAELATRLSDAEEALAGKEKEIAALKSARTFVGTRTDGKKESRRREWIRLGVATVRMIAAICRKTEE